jgi:signal transduction histidine kinase
MVHNRTTNFRSSAEQIFLGNIALASVNLAFLRPGIYLASTAFDCLIVIMLFALTGSFIVSALLAVISVAGTVPSVNSVVSSLVTLNKTDIEKVPLDVNDVVREAIALAQRELISHRVSLRMELAPALPMILGDRVQLQQVIINLVMNGIEAMQSVIDRPRELVVGSHQNETRRVRVTVTDSGVGISAENADRLFNAFFTTKSGGMGMGLSICRSIIEAHGGRMSTADNVGPGARFQFTLPLHQEDTL